MADDSNTKPLLSQSEVKDEASKRIAIRRYRRCQTAPSNAPLEPASASSDLTARRLFMQVHPSIKWVGLFLAVYFGIGTICFFMINDQIEGKKTNGVIDALYFCIVTMTTVGYGDLIPSSSLAKLLACAFVFSGMAVVGFILSKAADYLVEKQELLVIKALYRSGKVGKAAMLREVETNRVKYKLIVTAIVLLSLFIIGTIFLHNVEKLSLIDAFYCVCSTITTLGFGDKSFSTKGGRVFAILWILMGTICLAQYYLYLAEMQSERKQQVLANIVLERRMTFADLEAANLDYNGDVCAAEFIIYKLKEMGKISQDDIALVLEQFEVLDADHSGTLTREDLLIAHSNLR